LIYKGQLSTQNGLSEYLYSFGAIGFINYTVIELQRLRAKRYQKAGTSRRKEKRFYENIFAIQQIKESIGFSAANLRVLGKLRPSWTNIDK